MASKEDLEKKLQSLEEKKKELLLKKKEMEGREKIAERKARAKKLINLGAAVFEDYQSAFLVMEKDPEWFTATLRRSVTNAVNDRKKLNDSTKILPPDNSLPGPTPHDK